MAPPPEGEHLQKKPPEPVLSGLPGADLRKTMWEVQVPRVEWRNMANGSLPSRATRIIDVAIGPRPRPTTLKVKQPVGLYPRSRAGEARRTLSSAQSLIS